jgi:NADH-quinone oxidoreductase subunit M
MLWMVQRVFYGPTSSLVNGKASPDLLFREAVALWPVAVLMLIMGVCSPLWIRAIDPTVTALVEAIQSAPTPSPNGVVRAQVTVRSSEMPNRPAEKP